MTINLVYFYGDAATVIAACTKARGFERERMGSIFPRQVPGAPTAQPTILLYGGVAPDGCDLRIGIDASKKFDLRRRLESKHFRCVARLVAGEWRDVSGAYLRVKRGTDVIDVTEPGLI